MKTVLLIISGLLLWLPVFSQQALRGCNDTPGLFKSALIALPLQNPIYINSKKYAIPPDLHTRQFSFFCRQELKMKKAHLPLAFRIGSMEYCNWLEQKPGASKP